MAAIALSRSGRISFMSTAQTIVVPALRGKGGGEPFMRVAVEEGLKNVWQALEREGITVTKLTEGMRDIDAAVVTGLSSNVMGVHETNGNRYPVIEAAGRTAEEILSLLQSHRGRS